MLGLVLAVVGAAIVNGLLTWRAAAAIGEAHGDGLAVSRLRELHGERVLGLGIGVILLLVGGALTVRMLARGYYALEQLRANLHESEERYRSLAELTTDYAYAIALGPNGELSLEWATEGLGQVTGVALDELTSTGRIMQLVHADDREGFLNHMRDTSESTRQPHEFRLVSRHGSVRAMRDYSRPIWSEREGRVVRIYGAIQDVTDSKAHEGQLVLRAFTDPLTGLANRAQFMERLGHAVHRVARDGHGVAVLFVDLDRFKIVNDSLGHAAGDALLAGVAARLSSCVRGNDLVARLGGDEFTVLLQEIHAVGEAQQIAERMLSALRLPFVLAGHEVAIGASIGIACRLGGESPAEGDTLMREADTALYHAKSSGKGRAVIFDARLDTGTGNRLELETDLRRAIEQHELLLAFQPEVDLETGSIVGMEALVRWEHPVRGPIPAKDLIPIAEESGLIGRLGRWVLQEACRQHAAWRASMPTLAPLVLSVNLSGHQVREPDLVAFVGDTLESFGIDPTWLRLEITETVLMEDGQTSIDVLRALHQLGVKLAIDDFGTGYSSLSYLQRFPVDAIKIDRSFVIKIMQDATSQAIVRAVAALGQSVGLTVTAEGIETAEQWTRVWAAGCRFGQGYHFARPLSVDAMTALLAAGTTHRFQPSVDIISRARQLSEERWRDRRSLLTDEVRRLPEEFRGVFSAETVERLAREMLDSLDGSPVQNYLSALVYRGARDRLQQLAGRVTPPPGRPPRVLFVCITGAGRSVLAAALLETIGRGRVIGRAVGASPVDQFDGTVLKVVSELGADPPSGAPLPLTSAEVEAADAIVTLSCGDVCPLYAGKAYRDWSVEAPDGLAIEQVRRIASELEPLVVELLDQVSPAPGSALARAG